MLSNRQEADGGTTGDAKAFILSCEGSVGRLGSFAERIKRQAQSLTEWAREAGRLLPANYFSGWYKLDATTMEHEVYYDPASQRIVKRTRSGLYGLTTECEFLEPATPVEYLFRVQLMNRVFGTDVRLEGVWMDGDGQPTIVTSQDFIVAAHTQTPYPTLAEVDAFMRKRGFVPMRYVEYGWENPKTGVWVMDAHIKQFIKTVKGLVPVDLVMSNSQGIRPANS